MLLGHAPLVGLRAVLAGTLVGTLLWPALLGLRGVSTLIRLISNTENNVKSLIKLRFKRKFRPLSFTPKVLKISL